MGRMYCCHYAEGNEQKCRVNKYPREGHLRQRLKDVNYLGQSGQRNLLAGATGPPSIKEKPSFAAGCESSCIHDETSYDAGLLYSLCYLGSKSLRGTAVAAH